jgi:Icc protein
VTSTPLRLVQFTDLHLYGDAGRRLRGVVTLAGFEAALATARECVAPWCAVLLTGDLVQDDPEGYRHVRRLLGNSPVPVLCICGNHDEPEPLRAALGSAPFQVDGHAEFGRWLIVMLDSYLAGAASGRLSATELARLDATLAAHAHQHALVCLHHQPVPVGSRWIDELPLENPDDLFAVLDRHPQVRAVVWGHVHQVYDGDRHGVRLLGSPATSAQFKPRVDSFAIDDLPPGFRWLDLYADGRIETGVGRTDPGEPAAA